MKGRRYQIGPGAASLILVIVILCMTVLGILALISARADLKLSRRGVEMTRDYYEADAAAERALAELDACLEKAAGSDDFWAAVEDALPEGWALDGHEAVFEADAKADRRLICTAQILEPGSPARYRVTEHALRDETDWQETLFEEVW